MKTFYAALAALTVLACGNRNGGAQEPVIEEPSEKPIERFADTTYASVNNLKWELVVVDSLGNGPLEYLDDPYDKVDGTYTFRGNQRREMPVRGR